MTVLLCILIILLLNWTLLQSTMGRRANINYFDEYSGGLYVAQTIASSQDFGNPVAYKVKFGLMKQHIQQQKEPDLLVKPTLVKHGVLEVDGFCVTAELDKGTNCADTQFQLPLRALNHRAVWLRISFYCLHANIHMHGCTTVIFKISAKRIVSLKSLMCTLFFPGCSGCAPEACFEALSHCTVLCWSSQSGTSSTGWWNSTWESLHLIGWLVRVTDWLEQKVTVTSLEQPEWRCPT